jgi:hypothetical protein
MLALFSGANMPIPKKSFLAALAWLFNKIVDKAIDNWAALTLLITGGGVMTYLAAISLWLQPYGPVAWGAIALVAVLLLALIFLAYASARRQLVISNLIALKASSSKGNILAPHHEYERLNLADFYLPGILRVNNVRFQNCHLFGPISISMRGCTLTGSGLGQCEVIVVDDNALTTNVLVLEDCAIFDCRLQNITFLVSRAEWHNFPDHMKALPILAGRQTLGLPPNV